MQPNFFAADKDIAATLLIRDGFVGVSAPRLIWDHRVLVMVDQDPTTAFSWPVIAPESFDQTVDRTPWAVYLDLGGPFLVREIRLRHLADRPDHFLEGFTLAISEVRVVPAESPSGPRPAVARLRGNYINGLSDAHSLLVSGAEAKRIQVGVVHDKPQTHRPPGQGTHTGPRFPLHRQVRLVLKQLRRIR